VLRKLLGKFPLGKPKGILESRIKIDLEKNQVGGNRRWVKLTRVLSSGGLGINDVEPSDFAATVLVG
jgi:hypothetical protein